MRLLRQFATEPTVAVYALFRHLVFSYCVANGDLHLKNLSLRRRSDGTRELAPAYDLVNTQLAIGDQKFAILVGGADGPIRRSRWEQLAAYARIPPKAANMALSTQVRALEPMVALIRASFLPAEAQVQYERMVRERTGLIGPAAPDDEASSQ